MNAFDDFLLRLFYISPWSDADNYKENKIMTLFQEDEPDFDYYDEYPEEDPFISNSYPQSVDDLLSVDPGIQYPDMTEETYRIEVTSQLITLLQEFLSFSSREDLIKLIEKNI